MTNIQTVLVTGGFGYVGSRLTPELLRLGHRVRVLDLMLYGDAGLRAVRSDPRFATAETDGRLVLFREDIRHPDRVAEALAGVDAVIHLAAISNDPTGAIDEVLTRQVNFDSVGMLVALARGAGVRRFINASSSSVFGIKEEDEIDERLEPEPLTSYSRTKMLSEWLIIAAASPDFCTVNVRPATICGVSPRQRFDLTVNKLTADAVTKGVISVHGGQQRRPNVGITDVVALYRMLLDTEPRKICGRSFNFGFENHKVIAIAQMIAAELQDLRVEIQVTDAVDHRDYHISSQRIVHELGYVPVSSICREVAELRAALESGRFGDIESPEYYNLESMQLERNPGAYRFLSR